MHMVRMRGGGGRGRRDGAALGAQEQVGGRGKPRTAQLSRANTSRNKVRAGGATLILRAPNPTSPTNAQRHGRTMKNSPTKGDMTMSVRMALVTVTHSIPTMFMIMLMTMEPYLMPVSQPPGMPGNSIDRYWVSRTTYLGKAQ